ncbi:MAG: DUF6036 family nucleotidyltransferase [Phycisphaeraceae bacterium]
MLLDANQLAGLAILTGDSPILDLAREVSALIIGHGIDAAVIGGVAVVLHGHLRTTLDVDVYTTQSKELAAALEAAGFVFNAKDRQFEKGGIPVQLVTPSHVVDPPTHLQDISGVRTVSLADLISIKLRSGSENVLRAQDLADVIALMRHHALDGEFVPRISKDLRPVFRKLLRAIQNE